jgi:TusA-related sulfurtransferase
MLDTRGLLCPLPVIRTQDRVKELPTGTLLDIIATDPGTLHDIPAWCRVHGHRVIETRHDGPDIRIRIEVCET